MENGLSDLRTLCTSSAGSRTTLTSPSPAPPIASLTAALLSSMKERPTGEVGWAQLLPQRVGRGLGRGLGEDIQNHVCSSSSDQNCVDSASVMSVAW